MRLRGFVADVAGVEGGAVVVERPKPARQLVGQGHGGPVVSLALRQIQRPGLQPVQRLAGASSRQGRTQDGTASVDEQGPQVCIAALGDPAQASMVSRRVFAGHQPNPRGQVAPAVEARQVAGARAQRRGGEQPYAGNCEVALHGDIATSFFGKSLLDCSHVGLQADDMLELFGQGCTQDHRHVVPRIFKRLQHRRAHFA